MESHHLRYFLAAVAQQFKATTYSSSVEAEIFCDWPTPLKGMPFSITFWT
jgi:hypothetical protein